MNTTTTTAALPADVETWMRGLRLRHARALAVLMRADGLRALLTEAIAAATRRGGELAK